MTPTFDGLRVLAIESRRATEIDALIASHGGVAVVAPALREVPLDSNPEALAFAHALIRDEFDLVIFLTGVGLRDILQVVEPAGIKPAFVEALTRTKIVPRGPKPLAVLRELQVPVWATVPEPNTWRELLVLLDGKTSERPLQRARVAVQEYGVSNRELLDGLRTRGAHVTAVPVYRWALPEDVGPLKDAATALARGSIDVALFTTSVQVVHLLQIAAQMGIEADVRAGLARTVVASIGPTTSAELRTHGVVPDLEPSHPKLGYLVRETAERAARLLPGKRDGH